MNFNELELGDEPAIVQESDAAREARTREEYRQAARNKILECNPRADMLDLGIAVGKEEAEEEKEIAVAVVQKEMLELQMEHVRDRVPLQLKLDWQVGANARLREERVVIDRRHGALLDACDEQEERIELLEIRLRESRAREEVLRAVIRDMHRGRGTHVPDVCVMCLEAQ